MTLLGSSRLVPELVVSDLSASLVFWRDLIGFSVRYDRPEDGFAYLDLDGAELMLDQHHPGGRHWLSAPFAAPLGNGLNLQVTVAAVAPALERLAAARWPLVMKPEERWYRAGERQIGQRQFVVADPDGYRLRLAEALGSR